MPIIFQELIILSNKVIAPGIHVLRFQSEAIAAQARPGQFVMIRPTGLSEPLLPRPFSIHQVQGDKLELLFKVIGQGTRQLAALKKGDRLEVRGPLGKGFAFHADQEPILVAGGMGIAPLLFLARTWKKERLVTPSFMPRLFIGARTKEELLRLEAFRKAGVEVLAVTEDGSWGEKGLVTDLLKKNLKNLSARAGLFVCGPKPMLKAVSDWADHKKLACQLSLETHMACGLGACLGCVVAQKTDQGLSYVNVCQEGPVFDAHEVLWNE
jgi:dihydroorotate dehydrogenase electron transfer subunit